MKRVLQSLNGLTIGWALWIIEEMEKERLC